MGILSHAAPPDETLVEVVRDAVQVLLTEGEPAGARVLAGVDTFSPPSGKRSPAPVAVRAEVFGRDHFSCRYCGTRTIAVPVMRAMSAISPDPFPYHPP
ncbi:MAG: HNH endonuclease [Acidimicrobiales bacterium]